MNAIVSLNHFCEIHGPQTIFSTQTLREKSTVLSHHSTNVNNSSTSCCSACGSIGSKVIFMTEDKSSSIMFVSSEKSIFAKENLNSLKTITLRSLSCEVRRRRNVTTSNVNNFRYFRSQRTIKRASCTSKTRASIRSASHLKSKTRRPEASRSSTRSSS